MNLFSINGFYHFNNNIHNYIYSGYNYKYRYINVGLFGIKIYKKWKG